MSDLEITEGSIVVIAALDDVPEHQFEVHDVLDDFITGMALTGSYGEPPLEMVLRIADRLGTD